MFRHRPDRFEPVGALGHHLDVWVARQHLDQHPAGQLFVVDDDYSKRVGGVLSHGLAPFLRSPPACR